MKNNNNDFNLEDFLNQPRNEPFKYFYDLNIIQLKNIRTCEAINIGIVLIDNNEYRIKIIENFDNLINIFRVKDIEGLKFIIKMANDRVERCNGSYKGKVSDAISIIETFGINSSLPIGDAIDEVFKEYVFVGS